LASIISSGCSLLVGSTQAVGVIASDPEAVIVVDGQQVGVGSAHPSLRRDRSHAVTATTPDGRVGWAVISPKRSLTGYLDMLLAPYSVFALAAPGSYVLEPENVIVTIPPSNNEGELR
jgi:hypothetical protein